MCYKVAMILQDLYIFLIEVKLSYTFRSGHSLRALWSQDRRSKVGIQRWNNLILESAKKQFAGFFTDKKMLIETFLLPIHCSVLKAAYMVGLLLHPISVQSIHV
jgi:hypothetical protein